MYVACLSNTIFKIQVHHVNGEGKDAGVVYCEMQARQNTVDDRMSLEMLRALYPGDSGYKVSFFMCFLSCT